MDYSQLIILVVEDDPDARDLMQAVLEQRGAHIIVADNVTRAFELFTTVMPHVVISDIAMPDEDGVGLVRRIRALSSDEGGRTPAIAVSAYVAGSDRTRALAAGFDRYLHKPVDFDELLGTIEEVIDQKDNDKASA